MPVRLQKCLWVLCRGTGQKGRNEECRLFAVPVEPAVRGLQQSVMKAELPKCRKLGNRSKKQAVRLLESSVWLVLGTSSCQQSTGGGEWARKGESVISRYCAGDAVKVLDSVRFLLMSLRVCLSVVDWLIAGGCTHAFNPCTGETGRQNSEFTTNPFYTVKFQAIGAS